MGSLRERAVALCPEDPQEPTLCAALRAAGTAGPRTTVCSVTRGSQDIMAGTQGHPAGFPVSPQHRPGDSRVALDSQPPGSFCPPHPKAHLHSAPTGTSVHCLPLAPAGELERAGTAVGEWDTRER